MVEPTVKGGGCGALTDVEALAVLLRSAPSWNCIFNFSSDTSTVKQTILRVEDLSRAAATGRLTPASLIAGVRTSRAASLRDLPASFFRTVAYLTACASHGLEYQPICDEDLDRGKPAAGWCSVTALLDALPPAPTSADVAAGSSGTAARTVRPLSTGFAPEKRLLQAAPMWTFVRRYSDRRYGNGSNLELSVGVPQAELTRLHKCFMLSPYTPMAPLEKGGKSDGRTVVALLMPFVALLNAQADSLPLRLLNEADMLTAGVISPPAASATTTTTDGSHSAIPPVDTPPLVAPQRDSTSKLKVTSNSTAAGVTAAAAGKVSANASSGDSSTASAAKAAADIVASNPGGGGGTAGGTIGGTVRGANRSQAPDAPACGGHKAQHAARQVAAATDAQGSPAAAAGAAQLAGRKGVAVDAPACVQDAKAAHPPAPADGITSVVGGAAASSPKAAWLQPVTSCPAAFDLPIFRLTHGPDNRYGSTDCSLWWYINAGGTVCGPFTAARMVGLYARKVLQSSAAGVCGTVAAVRPPLYPDRSFFEPLDGLLHGMQAGGSYDLVRLEEVVPSVAAEPPGGGAVSGDDGKGSSADGGGTAEAVRPAEAVSSHVRYGGGGTHAGRAATRAAVTGATM